MKSLLLFTFMTLLVNTFWCGGKEEDIQPVSFLEGYWKATESNTKLFNKQNQLIGETKQIYKSGELEFDFIAESLIYREFTYGNEIRSGIINEEFGGINVVIGADTIQMNFNPQENSIMVLQTIDKDSLGYKVAYFTCER